MVRGGEDYEFGAFSLRVIPSIHSALFHKHYFNSRLAGNAPPGLKAPLKAGDFVEGQSMAYLLRLAAPPVACHGLDETTLSAKWKVCSRISRSSELTMSGWRFTILPAG